jgi:hypothetical protein
VPNIQNRQARQKATTAQEGLVEPKCQADNRKTLGLHINSLAVLSISLTNLFYVTANLDNIVSRLLVVCMVRLMPHLSITVNPKIADKSNHATVVYDISR